MIDYSVYGLNQFLQPENSPVVKSGVVSGYNFDSDYERNIITTSKVAEIIADKISAGTISVSIGVGGVNVTINGEDGNIVVNDGSNDRVLIGYQEDGF